MKLLFVLVFDKVPDKVPDKEMKVLSFHTLSRCRLSACFVLLAGLLSLRAAVVPEGFIAETVVSNINAATALTIAKDGTVFFTEQTGALRIYRNGQLLPAPALDLSERLDTYWERGLIGVTLHPEFPRTPHLFIVYVAKAPYTHHVISRFTLANNVVDPASEVVLLEGDDQSMLGGPVPAGHQGGPICFGADGKLYVGLGEQTAGQPAQSLTTLQGKILRINPEGSIPEDNPFVAQTGGKYASIWAIGIRNPFGLVPEPGTGRLFETDVGDAAFEEVNEIIRGGNYGWPNAEGPSNDPAYVNPLYSYRPTVGRSICGGAFYSREIPKASAFAFPEKWRGKFLFLDWAAHWLKALDPAAPTNVITLARGLDGPVAVQVAPDGSLFVLNRGTIWRDGKKFAADSGSLVRISYEPVKASGLSRPVPFPRTLSDSKLFPHLEPLQLREDFVALEINHPPWQPGIRARQWISVPAGEAIGFSAEGPWQFPVGTIVVQHYQLAEPSDGKGLETHIMWFVGPRTVRAAAYRWGPNNSEALLVEESEIIPLLGHKRFWLSPGVEDPLNLDTLIAGFQFPLNTRQLHREISDAHSGQAVNQLQQWNERGWFQPKLENIPALPRLASFGDESAPLEARVRSYLDVNCSCCHQPGGFSRSVFDARFSTPLAQQNLLNGALVSGDLGLAAGKVIVPGHPESSIMLERLKRTDFFRMPPTTINDERQPIVPLLEAWISGMGP